MRLTAILPCALATLGLTVATACPASRQSPGEDEVPVADAQGSELEPPSSAEDAALPDPDPDRPQLVVVLVIDQMRADVFERYDAQLTGGLRRLRDEGLFYTQARHTHAVTETGPGHATIATGTFPAHHGIVANSWYEAAQGAKVGAVEDRAPQATVLGSGSHGRDPIGASAHRLLRPPLGDWMHAADPEALVVSLSLKDRAALLMGGREANLALWYDDVGGGFTTSKPYAQTLPAWVAAYNAKDRAAALYGEVGWVPCLPADQYPGSRADTAVEVVANFNDFSLTRAFPHVIDPKTGKAPRNVVRDIPFGDHMTLELAGAAIRELGLGKDPVPDLLLLSMSGGDYAGHRYGPMSVEMHDYFLRLDGALGAFLDTLDAEVGRDGYLLVLTSDHGAAPMPEYGKDLGIPTAGRFVAKQHVPAMLPLAAKSAGLPKALLPAMTITNGVNLDFDEAVDEATRVQFRAALAERIRARSEVADAWTRDELTSEARTREEDRTQYAAAYRRSHHPERSPDVIIQLEPGVYHYPLGAGHGTPYDYDQRVPLILFGEAFVGPAKTIESPVSTVDIAPTLAELVGVPLPEPSAPGVAALDGGPLPR